MLRSPWGRALFGRGGSLNTGAALRVGIGKGKDGEAVFRAAGEAVDRAAGTRHIDLVNLGSFDDYIRLIKGGR